MNSFNEQICLFLPTELQDMTSLLHCAVTLECSVTIPSFSVFTKIVVDIKNLEAEMFEVETRCSQTALIFPQKTKKHV